MQLFVRGQSLHTLEVSGFESVEWLKAQVCALEGVEDAEEQVLSFNGAPLLESEPLVTCGLSEVRFFRKCHHHSKNELLLLLSDDHSDIHLSKLQHPSFLR